MSEIHVITVTLAAEECHKRLPLSWKAVDAEVEWKTLSWVRNKETWIEPTLYSSLDQHARLATSLLLLNSTKLETTLALYPVSTLGANNNLYVGTTSSPPQVCTNTRRVAPEGEQTAYVVCVKAQGKDQERNVIKAAVEHARQLVGGRPKEDVRLPEVFSGIGICTWEAIGKDDSRPVRPTLDLLLELVPKDLPIKTFLIDDGWHDVAEHATRPAGPALGRLKGFDAWDGMGASMSDVIAALKDRGCQEVGVWMTLQGYWYAIDENSPLCQKYDCRRFATCRTGQPRGGAVCPLQPVENPQEADYQWLPSPEKAGQFWLDWFVEMKSWGVSFIKVDNQADYDGMTGSGALQAQQAMWSGMLEACQQVWGGVDRLIMCMSHNERMLNGPGALDFDRPAGNLIFRNSDDFNIGLDPHRHADFVAWNLYQSILTSHLSLIPDFDMFSSAPASHLPVYHGLLRALSPGPLLLADAPEIETDMKFLDRLLARKRPDGPVYAVKATAPGQVLTNRWFRGNLTGSDVGPALIAGSSFDHAEGAIIGAWNTRSGSVASDAVTIWDVRDALGVVELEGEWALWRTGLSHPPADDVVVLAERSTDKVYLNLLPDQCESIVVARLWQLADVKVAVVGMLDKFATLGGIKNLSIDSNASKSSTNRLSFDVGFASEFVGVLIIGQFKTPVTASLGGATIKVSVRELQYREEQASLVRLELGQEGRVFLTLS